jgi:flagellar motor switch protein FliM
VLGGHLAALLARWGQSIALDLAAAGPTSASGSLIAVAVRAEVAGGSGMVRIHAPAEWLALGNARARLRPTGPHVSGLLVNQRRAAVGRLSTVASVELATTTLRLAELEGAHAGDAVVFDGAAWPDEGERLVSLRIGDQAAPARLSATGQIVLAGRFEAAERRAVVRKTGAMTDKGDKTSGGAELLAAAPIEIVAEVGRVVLRGDEVLGLAEGSVLSLGRPGTTVDLVVGGRTWARGELVNIDGELGVRITELAR